MQEDRDFLSAQGKTGHRGKMGNFDKVLTKTEENLSRRTEDRQKRKSKEEKEKNS